MRVAILYNPRPERTGEVSDDAFEEYDQPDTIDAIAAALRGLGLDVSPVVADATFPLTLERGGFNFVFNIAEGTGRRCREAVPAAVCEFLGLPCTGSDALTLAATLDKWVARRLVSPDVAVARGVLVDDVATAGTLDGLPFPVVVKPNDEGSSKGIGRESLCADAGTALERCRWLGRRYGCPVLVEEFLPGAEVTVGIRGNRCDAAVIGLMEVAPVGETDEPFLYSLEIKRDFRRRVRYHVPPRLEADVLRTIREQALTAYRMLGCRDVARLDFRLDAAGEPRFLECNPLPGLCPAASDLVILARAVDAEPERAYDRLVQGILRDAARRYGITVEPH